MHDDAYIGGRSENNIKCVVHEDLGWKNRTTPYILPRHWLYEWFSQFHRCETYLVPSRSPSIGTSSLLVLLSRLRMPSRLSWPVWRRSHDYPEYPPLQSAWYSTRMSTEYFIRQDMWSPPRYVLLPRYDVSLSTTLSFPVWVNTTSALSANKLVRPTSGGRRRRLP